MRSLLLRYVALAFTVGFTFAENAVAAPNGPGPRILLHVVDRASVPNYTLIHAREVVTRVFAEMGITATWLDSSELREDTPYEPSICIVINGKAAGENIERSKRAMGLTPQAENPDAQHLVYVFYDRVKDFTEVFGSRSSASASMAETLAYVILHEMGHLLLPYPAHFPTGIMCPSWDLKDFERMTKGELFFTRQQVELIKNALLRRFASSDR